MGRISLALLATAVASPYYMGQGYTGPDIERMRNLSEITADINEQLRLTEMTEQFNKWAAQVENDFKDFQKKLTVAEINAELARTHEELVTHFESMAVQLETWDMENQEVMKRELSNLMTTMEDQMRQLQTDFESFNTDNTNHTVVDQLTESVSSALNKWGDEITGAFSNVGNYIYDAFNFVVVPINQTVVIPAVAPVDAV